ncbi:MAG: DUF3486 family protein [Alphaproteobacteria bacterium]
MASQKKANKKTKRGRLSSIDVLSDAAQPHVVWAVDELNKRDHTQDDIREQLNTRLALLDPPEGPISKSAFNRYSIRIAITGRALMEARETAAMLAEKMDKLPEGDIGRLLNEIIKTMVFDLLTDAQLKDGSASMAMLKAAAQSLRALELARKTNFDTEADLRTRFTTQLEEAATDAAVAAGLSDEQAQAIREKVLGVVKKPGS